MPSRNIETLFLLSTRERRVESAAKLTPRAWLSAKTSDLKERRSYREYCLCGCYGTIAQRCRLHRTWTLLTCLASSWSRAEAAIRPRRTSMPERPRRRCVFRFTHVPAFVAGLLVSARKLCEKHGKKVVVACPEAR